MYARVFPDPVNAWTATSLLVRRRGIAVAWQGVGTGDGEERTEEIALRVESERGGLMEEKEGDVEDNGAVGELTDDSFGSEAMSTSCYQFSIGQRNLGAAGGNGWRLRTTGRQTLPAKKFRQEIFCFRDLSLYNIRSLLHHSPSTKMV